MDLSNDFISMTKFPTIFTKHYTLTAIVLIVIVGVSLLWITQSRLDGYYKYQNHIAVEAVKGISSQVKIFVAEKNRMVQLFAKQHQKLIMLAYNNRDDDIARDKMVELVNEYFPKHFSTTLSSPVGVPIYEDFDGNLGKLCRADLISFGDTNSYDTQIHPSGNNYHFDVMARVDGGGSQPILFVSFLADILGDILTSVQSPAHLLMLIHRDKNHLIEVIDKGARNRVSRDDYRLNEEEISRILYAKPIPGTQWEAIDFIKPGVFQKYQMSLIVESAVIFAVCLIVFIFMVIRLYKEEQTRKTIEKDKNSMIAVIAHEFRTPLTAISGAIDLIIGLKKKGDDHSNDDNLHSIISNNSKRLRSLVDNFLDIQQLESGQFKLDLQKCELGEIIITTVKNLESYGSGSNVKFILENILDNVMIYGDSQRISQVLGNLLSNAVKYGGSNKSVTITTTHINHFIRISVIDQGDGIPQAFYPKVFTRFAMAHANRDPEISSSGLGLHICQLLILQHGGKIDFTTKIGQGTTFYFDLPTLDEDNNKINNENVDRLAS